MFAHLDFLNSPKPYDSWLFCFFTRRKMPSKSYSCSKWMQLFRNYSIKAPSIAWWTCFSFLMVTNVYRFEFGGQTRIARPWLLCPPALLYGVPPSCEALLLSLCPEIKPLVLSKENDQRLAECCWHGSKPTFFASTTMVLYSAVPFWVPRVTCHQSSKNQKSQSISKLVSRAAKNKNFLPRHP